jgi:ATP-dependent Clp protease ATP-binding subunit ClpX
MGYRVRRSSQALLCSFCGVTARAGRAVARDAAEGTSICADCLAVCGPLLATTPPTAIPSPTWIKARLDRSVIGQERAKRKLAVAVHTHLRRLDQPDDGVQIGKSNVLLLGPTGTGKTHLVRALARLLEVPLHIADATSLTEAGYVGEDVQSLLVGLVRAAGGDLQRAQRGILYLDEVDKLSTKGNSNHGGRDVSGEGVQQALLRLIEGARVSIQVPALRGPPRTQEFDTSSVLVICGGAFEGLDGLIARRTRARSMGFQAGAPQGPPASVDVRAEDLHRFGLIPELVGRLPVLATLEPLDEDALVRVLTEPRDALLRQYRRLLLMDGVRLHVTPDGLRAVARRCLELGTGARALRAVMEQTLLDVMYETPSRDDVEDVWITEDVVLGLAAPLLGLRSDTG